MIRALSIILALGAVTLALVPAEAAIDARMLRYPDVSDSRVTFVYGGDIWIVDKQGGQAHPGA